MIKIAIVLGLALAAQGQFVRSSFGGSPAQVIPLGRGGTLGGPRVQFQGIRAPVQLIQPQALPIQVAAPIAHRPLAFAPARLELEDNTPTPYAFAFDTEDEFGTKMGRQESSNGNAVTGSYMLADASGISRIVTYVADDSGFHAEVKTNEPGTISSAPADVVIHSNAPAKK